jgi:branched-chain amino acid transport system substrate-binding protein
MWPVTKYLGNLGIKTAVHVNPDDAHGRAHYAERAQQMEAVGVKSIGEDFYPRGATEFYPILRRLLAKNPDFLDTGTGGIRDEALLTKQARELGFKGPILVWAVSTGQLEKIVGKELLEGTLSTAPPPLPGLPMKGKTKELFDWYVSKFDVKEFDSAALSPYGIVELLTHAIKKAQSIDAFKVAGALEKINKDNPIETAVGKTYIDSLGFGIPRVMTFPFNVYLFKDGKWQEVGGGMPSLEWQKK